MNRVESAFCNLVGIKPESDGIKWYSVAFLEVFAKFDWLFHHTIYEGTPLPSEGPALIVANHTNMWDAAEGYRIGQRSGRIVRTFARANLLDPTAQEPETVKARTGRKKDILNASPVLVKHLLASVLNGAEAISIMRGGGLKDLRDFRARGHESFARGMLTAMFISETREKSGKLVDPKPGAEILARDNPDIPIYPVGIAVRPHWVSTGKPFTCNQMLNDPEYGALARANFTVLLCDKIADQLPPWIRQDWYEVQRPLALSRRRKST